MDFMGQKRNTRYIIRTYYRDEEENIKRKIIYPMTSRAHARVIRRAKRSRRIGVRVRGGSCQRSRPTPETPAYRVALGAAAHNRFGHSAAAVFYRREKKINKYRKRKIL